MSARERPMTEEDMLVLKIISIARRHNVWIDFNDDYTFFIKGEKEDMLMAVKDIENYVRTLKGRYFK